MENLKGSHCIEDAELRCLIEARRIFERGCKTPVDRQEIAKKAYELFEKHGQHGHDWEDWFSAEKEFTCKECHKAWRLIDEAILAKYTALSKEFRRREDGETN